jgi:hypothetical protein
MALADLTKQIAQQALLSATAPSKEQPAASTAATSDSLGAVILGQIAALQKQLKDDEELVVTFQQGAERIRVMEIFLASPNHRPRCAPFAHARGSSGCLATTGVQDGQDCARRETRPGGSDYGETERFQLVITRVSRS